MKLRGASVDKRKRAFLSGPPHKKSFAEEELTAKGDYGASLGVVGTGIGLEEAM